MKNKRVIANVVEVAIGIAMAVCGYAGIIEEYWGGMGTALVMVGSIMLFRQFRYKTNEIYKEKVDVEISDERNKYLRMKAWSWAGYLFVLIAAFATIILKVLKFDQFSLIASGCVCLVVLLYWISFVVLKRKY